MSTNKHAIIRYHALDRCFSNFRRRFYIEDLIEACNEALFSQSDITDGVKKRQVQYDIKFMESEAGYSIPLERIKDGKRVYFRYEDKDFSIRNLPINQGEVEQLQDTLTILSRFKGMPQFEWIEETQVRLAETFNLKDNIQHVVDFEQNPYLKGLTHFSNLFNAIQNQLLLNIEYQSFKQTEPMKMLVHPWHLKQYNNRWFLFAWYEEYENLVNLPLDRIVSIEATNGKYKENTTIDFDEYFEDVVGVTFNPDSPIEKIVLRVSKNLWPYIESKPLHGSQKVINRADDFVEVTYELQINYEFESLLFSHMDAVEVMEPQDLRARIKDKAQSILQKYS